MKINDKPNADPAAELPMVPAYMRWTLEAAEAVAGKTRLNLILRENGLDKFIDNYPPETFEFSPTVQQKDYSTLCTGLVKAYGQEGMAEVIRIGRISTKPALDKQGKLFNLAARTAAKFLPLSLQVKTVLENMQSGFRKIYGEGGHDVHLSIEDRGDKWAYIEDSCGTCAGKESNVPICWTFVGTLEESVMWLTGKEFQVDQVQCRAMGEPLCVWEISKKAKK